MKKTAFASLILALVLMVSSCSKTTTNSNGGSWTFKTITYNVNAIQNNSGSIVWRASDNASTLAVDFGSALPTTSGTYTVINGTPGVNQVSIQQQIAGTTNYTATGSGNTTVQVTVTNGKIAVTGSGIMMQNNAVFSTDSAALTLNVKQP